MAIIHMLREHRNPIFEWMKHYCDTSLTKACHIVVVFLANLPVRKLKHAVTKLAGPELCAYLGL